MPDRRDIDGLVSTARLLAGSSTDSSCVGWVRLTKRRANAFDLCVRSAMILALSGVVLGALVFVGVVVIFMLILFIVDMLQSLGW